MTPGELKRTIDFIVEHQAKFEANIQMLLEADQQQREADERLRQSQATLTAALVRVTEISRGSDRIAKIDGRPPQCSHQHRRAARQRPGRRPPGPVINGWVSISCEMTGNLFQFQNRTHLGAVSRCCGKASKGVGASGAHKSLLPLRLSLCPRSLHLNTTL